MIRHRTLGTVAVRVRYYLQPLEPDPVGRESLALSQRPNCKHKGGWYHMKRFRHYLAPAYSLLLMSAVLDCPDGAAATTDGNVRCT